MSAVHPTVGFPFFRSIEVCPYSQNCRYASACVYEGTPAARRDTAGQLHDMAVRAAQRLLGTALVLSGAALTFTLFLIPLGLPLALLGVALLVTSREAAD